MAKSNKPLDQTTEKVSVEAKYLSNLSQPTHFCDHIAMNSRSDNLSVLRFYSHLPEGLIEQCRITVTQEVLKSCIDLLCRQTQYYPDPPQSSTKSKSD